MNKLVLEYLNKDGILKAPLILYVVFIYLLRGYLSIALNSVGEINNINIIGFLYPSNAYLYGQLFFGFVGLISLLTLSNYVKIIEKGYIFLIERLRAAAVTLLTLDMVAFVTLFFVQDWKFSPVFIFLLLFPATLLHSLVKDDHCKFFNDNIRENTAGVLTSTGE